MPDAAQAAMRLRFGWWILPALLLGCVDSRRAAGPSLSTSDDLVLQILPNLDWRALDDDHVVITAAQVSNRVLHLSVQFGGGCKEHSFALVAGDSFGESFPPFTLFRLVHDAQGDPCDALLARTLHVDLSPIVALLQPGNTALRFELVEPGERRSDVGELLLTF